MICSLLSACSGGYTDSFTPSPEGGVIASIKTGGVSIPDIYPPVVISYKSYLRIQKIPPSTDLSLTETLITKDHKEPCFGGLTWSPNGRSVAFTTGNVARDYVERRPFRLWTVGLSGKPKKSLIAENVHSFRWEDDTHLVYVTEDGEIYRAAISDDVAVLELKTLFSAGHLLDADDRAYHYCGLSGGGFEFNNPISPNSKYFVYGNGSNLTIVNLSTAAIEKSFPLDGLPISFWWDDGSGNLVIGVQKKKDRYEYTHHYYLYQLERGLLTNIANRLEDTSQFSPYKPSGRRVWLSDGKHFILNSGYPYHKTWLFNTASLSAVWMEREIERFEDGNFSQPQRIITTLPLEDGEVDSSKEPLPGLVIEPSPAGNLLAVRLPEGKQKHEKQTSTCYVLKIVTGPKGEMSLDVVKKVESRRIKRFIWSIREDFIWTADGRGLLFVAGDKFRLESIL